MPLGEHLLYISGVFFLGAETLLNKQTLLASLGSGCHSWPQDAESTPCTCCFLYISQGHVPRSERPVFFIDNYVGWWVSPPWLFFLISYRWVLLSASFLCLHWSKTWTRKTDTLYIKVEKGDIMYQPVKRQIPESSMDSEPGPEFSHLDDGNRVPRASQLPVSLIPWEHLV